MMTVSAWLDVFLTSKTGVLCCSQTLLILNYHFQPDLSCIIHTEFATLDNLNKYKMRILFISIVICSSYGSTALSPTLRVASIMRPHIINSILFSSL